MTCYPNAGLPDEHGHYDETPQSLALKMRRFVDEGWVNVIGGCCGTTPAHVRELAALASGRPARRPAPALAAAVSGIEVLYPSEDNRPVLVGERTNVIGSRKFKELIVAEKFEEAAEIGRAQVKGGAQVIDVCLANPDRDELADMELFLDRLTRKVKVPLMIDSTDAVVLERALKLCQGKAIINSINLEDGEERFEKVVPLLRRYGAAVVVGCIDEDKQQGMAVTPRAQARHRRALPRAAHRQVRAARRATSSSTRWCSPSAPATRTTSARRWRRSKGVRAIKARFPECKTILGISNVSFGLPPAGREVLNAVFLYHCTKAGLDYAIVNTEKLERYASIPEEERRLSEDLIEMRGEDPVAAFAAHFRGRKKEAKAGAPALPLDERLARYIVEGSRDGLLEDLELKLGEAGAARHHQRAADGRHGRGRPPVQRQRAHRRRGAPVRRGDEGGGGVPGAAHGEDRRARLAASIVLATVKGDVHDIGKNLVEIILTNNGYRVINLGIKVPPEELIAAYHAHKPDAIGLSGLLVKSAQQMVITAQDLREAGIEIPLFVGGAALTRRFTATRIAAEYPGITLYAQGRDGRPRPREPAVRRDHP